uniref:Uncharacterized protein n=2 Tax=Oryza punctata TaxID=4537 RepID=A0A0E0JVB3_ORYPU
MATPPRRSVAAAHGLHGSEFFGAGLVLGLPLTTAGGKNYYYRVRWRPTKHKPDVQSGMFVKNYGNLQDIELLLCDLTDAGYNDDADVSEEGSDDGNIVDIGTLVPLLFDDDEAGRAAMMQPDKIVVMVRKSIISHATTCRVLARSGEEQQQLISWAVKSRTSEYIFEPQGKLQERHTKKLPSFAVTVGDSLYLLDLTSSREHWFGALVYKPGGATDDYGGRIDWHCQSLPPLPYEPYSCSFVGAYGDIWVSTNGHGTFSFDTALSVWTKQGEWTLPFCGLAEYVPEYNLWFGLSSGSNNTHHLCAFDLASATQCLGRPQDTQGLAAGDILPAAPWIRFFHSKFKVSCCDMETETYGVFSGVEVEPCGKAGRGLRMVKHRSECYRLDDILREWVL